MRRYELQITAVTRVRDVRAVRRERSWPASSYQFCAVVGYERERRRVQQPRRVGAYAENFTRDGEVATARGAAQKKAVGCAEAEAHNVLPR